MSETALAEGFHSFSNVKESFRLFRLTSLNVLEKCVSFCQLCNKASLCVTQLMSSYMHMTPAS